MAVQKRYIGKAMQAAGMVARGISYAKISQELGVTEATVCHWMQDPKVQAEFDKCIGDIQRANYGKAMTLVFKQIDNDKLPWLAQGAARIAIESFDKRLNRNDGDVTIHFESGQSMPDIGVPDLPDSDA